MFNKLILICLLSGISFPSFAEWIEFDRDQEFTYSTNVETWNVKDKYNQVIEVWMKAHIHTDLTKDGLSIGDYNLYQYSIKCNERKLGIMAAAAYKNRKVLESQNVSYVKYDSILPDSRGDFLSRTVCNIVFNEDSSST